MREILREIASLADGAVFSSKKDHFVPIGGFLATDDDDVARQARELVVVYEGFPHYGGLAGHDMEALAQGIREAADEPTVAHYVGQVRYLAGLLQEAGVPIVEPVGAHAVFLDAKRFLPHLTQEQFPAQMLAAAIYVAGGVRSMERGIVSGQHGTEPYDGLELVRLTIPRRAYSREHLDYVADTVLRVFAARGEIPGLELVYEPPTLRFFQARFEPLAPVPSFDGDAGQTRKPGAGSIRSGDVGQAGDRLGHVEAVRRDVVRRVGVEEGGEQLDLRAARARARTGRRRTARSRVPRTRRRSRTAASPIRTVTACS